MSWSEFLTRMLESSTKVDKAAVFNTKGQPVATTEDLEVSERDGLAILHCLQDPAHTLTRINLDETDFRCVQGNDSAVVGTSINRKGRVLVARLTEEALIVVIGSAVGRGSFLFEVQQNLLERTRRQMVPQGPIAHGAGEGGSGSQQAMQSQQQRLPIIPPPVASQDQVLVQLHD